MGEPDALRPAGWFETQAEEEERLQRELEWVENLTDDGITIIGHVRPGPTAELVAYVRAQMALDRAGRDGHAVVLPSGGGNSL